MNKIHPNVEANCSIMPSANHEVQAISCHLPCIDEDDVIVFAYKKPKEEDLKPLCQKQKKSKNRERKKTKYILSVDSIFNIGQSKHSQTDQPRNSSRSKKNNLRNRVHPYLTEKAQGFLDEEQSIHLREVLDETYEIVSKDGDLTIHVTPKELIQHLQLCCQQLLHYNGIRLGGSGATSVLAKQLESNFNDLDFTLYLVHKPNFDELLQIEEQVLGYFIERECQVILSPREIYERFFLDSVKVQSCPMMDSRQRESWSLITLGKQGCKTIDIRFVYRSKRSYVFSTDSFEIILDSLLSSNNPKKKILVESLYGNYEEAMFHLQSGILCTNQPGQVRRGILRYCYELAKGRMPKPEHRARLEETFVQAFLAEKHICFEDILTKFLQRHSSNSLAFIQNLADLLAEHENTNSYLKVLHQFIQELEDGKDNETYSRETGDQSSDGDQLVATDEQ